MAFFIRLSRRHAIFKIKKKVFGNLRKSCALFSDKKNSLFFSHLFVPWIHKIGSFQDSAKSEKSTKNDYLNYVLT